MDGDAFSENHKAEHYDLINISNRKGKDAGSARGSKLYRMSEIAGNAHCH